MNKGMIRALTLLACLLLPLSGFSEGEIYRVVDADGNVTFTDQAPFSGAEPMNLPPLSVIQTDVQVPETPSDAASAEITEPTPRELRKQFKDFRITQPQPDETFWGTANSVVVAWGSSQPVPAGMNTLLYVDGVAQKAPATGSVTLTLARGEHRVYAELRNKLNRRIMTTPTVTFFVKQHSVNNAPRVTPNNGGP